MKKIEKTKTPEEFKKITRVELYKLWFGASWKDNPMTDGQIAKMYGVEKSEVKAKRKELKLNWITCGILFVAGGNKYKSK